MTNCNREGILGVILAGGKSRRFGESDKFFQKLTGETLLSRVIERISTQVDMLIINSNSERKKFSEYPYDIIQDTIPGYAGPLAGILTGMEWASEYLPEYKWVVTFAADAPFIPLDCVDKMHNTAINDDANIVCAASGGRTHPVCALWQTQLSKPLRIAITQENIRKIDTWTESQNLSIVEFPIEPFDPFFNINHLEDLVQAEKISKLFRD